jgi:hypothetical protein
VPGLQFSWFPTAGGPKLFGGFDEEIVGGELFNGVASAAAGRTRTSADAAIRERVSFNMPISLQSIHLADAIRRVESIEFGNGLT